MKLGQIDNAFDSDFHRDLVSEVESSEDVRKYLLPLRKIGQNMQEDIDIIVTDGKLNDDVVRQKLDLLYNSVLQSQNATNLFFESFPLSMGKILL